MCDLNDDHLGILPNIGTGDKIKSATFPPRPEARAVMWTIATNFGNFLPADRLRHVQRTHDGQTSAFEEGMRVVSRNK